MIFSCILVSQRNHPEDGHTNCQNTFVTTMQKQYVSKIKVHMLVLNTFHASS